MRMSGKSRKWFGVLGSLLCASNCFASSHREAPFVTRAPKTDGTDLYMFRSYETGRSDYITVLANYQPLQDAYGGPNYFTMDPDALYEIHFDNNGDAKEDLTFQFQFSTEYRKLAIPVGPSGAAQTNPIPLVNAGVISATNNVAQNVVESYELRLIRGNRRASKGLPVRNAVSGVTSFRKPIDNIGEKSIPDYANYSKSFIHSISIPGCSTTGRVFVGQRKEGFAVNLGKAFDLINLNPVGAVDGAKNTIGDKNITTLGLEIPISCLLGTSGDPVIGAWTTASLPARRELRAQPTFVKPVINSKTPFVQVSRLGNPLVNELVIGIEDKDRFNSSSPMNDVQFAKYVTNPTLPALIEALFGSAGVKAPTLFPRTDLVSVFLTGVQGLNQPANVKASEMLRLNTSVAAKAAADQKTLGVLAGDTAGFPNGRRPGDDVVDAALRVSMGALLTSKDAPSGTLPYTDQVAVSAADFDSTFPYLKSPLSGSADATANKGK